MYRKSFYRGIILGLLGAIVLIAALLAGWRMLAPESFCRVTGTSLANPGTYTAQNNLQIESAEIIAPNTEHYNKYKNDTTPASETKNAADDSKVEELADKPSSTEDEVPTKPSDITTSDKVKESSKTDKKNVEKKRYDTITKKRFLTTMAKEYYGDYNLWPFIYDENIGSFLLSFYSSTLPSTCPCTYSSIQCFTHPHLPSHLSIFIYP